MTCPHCRSRYVRIIPAHLGDRLWRCLRCDHRWHSDPPPLRVPSDAPPDDPDLLDPWRKAFAPNTDDPHAS